MSQMVVELKDKWCRSLQRGNSLEIPHLKFMVESDYGIVPKSVSKPGATQVMCLIKCFQVQAAVQIVWQEMDKLQFCVNYD